MDTSDCDGKQDPSTIIPYPASTGLLIDDTLDASLRPAAAVAATLGSLSCSASNSSRKTRGISGGSSTTSHSGGSSSGDSLFPSQLQAHVDAGHRGLEAAFRLMCQRLLDLESCWEKAQEVSLCGQLVGLDPSNLPQCVQFGRSALSRLRTSTTATYGTMQTSSLVSQTAVARLGHTGTEFQCSSSYFLCSLRGQGDCCLACTFTSAMSNVRARTSSSPSVNLWLVRLQSHFTQGPTGTTTVSSTFAGDALASGLRTFVVIPSIVDARLYLSVQNGLTSRGHTGGHGQRKYFQVRQGLIHRLVMCGIIPEMPWVPRNQNKKNRTDLVR